VALFRGPRIIQARSIATKGDRNCFVRDFGVLLKGIKKNYPALTDAIVCSVVPAASKMIAQALKKNLDGKVFIAGQNFKVPIKNGYSVPRQVGQDRLACAYAAKELYGCPTIVIDFGTALTIDIVSAKGVYQGGMIVPGISLSLKALTLHTALLPEVNFELPRTLIGRNTKESILSGMFHGYIALIEGVVKKLKKQISAKPVVVLTGGYGKLMCPFLRPSIDKFDPHLIFKGLLLAFIKNS
jgi:type III pantothenate kinase